MRYILLILMAMVIGDLEAQVSLIKKNESCKGRKDGRIEVRVGGDLTELDYTWTMDGKPFPGGRVISGLAPGDYSVTVTSPGGCMGFKSAKVWPGQDVSVDISARLLSVDPKPLGCGVRPVFTYSLTALANGGKAPYYCSWGANGLGETSENGGGGACTLVVSGSFINQTVVVIDSNGCVDSDGFKKIAAIKLCPKDPNDITGPEGVDTLKWVSVREVMDYAVRFENDPIFATSNASVVFVTVPIDDNIDPFSFRLGTMGFGDKVIEVPENSSFFQERLDYSQDLGFMLDVTAGLDLPNSRFFWLMETIDPITGQPPSDPAAGFLPVNDTLTGSGEGFINFQCKPKSTTLTGETVDHQASIIFDLNDPLLTNTWTNTVDAFAPTTTDDPLPDTMYSNIIPFEFSVLDDPGGCGVQHTQVLLSTDNEVFQPNGLLTDIDSIALVLNWGNTYYYKIISTDLVDNSEAVMADSFYIIPERGIEFLSPQENVFCQGDSLYVDLLLTSLVEVDLYMSSDSGQNYILLEDSLTTWPYGIELDTSLLLDTVFFKARNDEFDIEAISYPITVRPLPVVDAGDPAEGCINEILFVEATGANQYVWAPDSIIGTPTSRYSNVYADVSQWAWVQGTDVYGCSAIDSVYITVYPDSRDTLPQPLCEGDSIFINGQWEAEEGFYTTTYVNVNGCDSVIVSEVYFETPCIWAGGVYVYVDHDATGDNNGTSWTNAFNDLNDAIYVAGRYANVDQIWVAEGTYHPHPTMRDTSFVLKDSIHIYGGFLGVETMLEERSLDPELVFLSGDINLTDTLWDNSYHTVILDSTCVNCVLDGLTIHYGYADQAGNDTGAGVLNAGTGLVKNVVFERNFATELGAAVYSSGSSASLVFDGCTFRLNTSSLGRDVVNLNGAQVLFTGLNSLY